MAEDCTHISRILPPGPIIEDCSVPAPPDMVEECIRWDLLTTPVSCPTIDMTGEINMGVYRDANNNLIGIALPEFTITNQGNPAACVFDFLFDLKLPCPAFARSNVTQDGQSVGLQIEALPGTGQRCDFQLRGELPSPGGMVKAKLGSEDLRACAQGVFLTDVKLLQKVTVPDTLSPSGFRTLNSGDTVKLSTSPTRSQGYLFHDEEVFIKFNFQFGSIFVFDLVSTGREELMVKVVDTAEDNNHLCPTDDCVQPVLATVMWVDTSVNPPEVKVTAPLLTIDLYTSNAIVPEGGICRAVFNQSSCHWEAVQQPTYAVCIDPIYCVNGGKVWIVPGYDVTDADIDTTPPKDPLTLTVEVGDYNGLCAPNRGIGKIEFDIRRGKYYIHGNGEELQFQIKPDDSLPNGGKVYFDHDGAATPIKGSASLAYLDEEQNTVIVKDDSDPANILFQHALWPSPSWQGVGVPGQIVTVECLKKVRPEDHELPDIDEDVFYYAKCCGRTTFVGSIARPFTVGTSTQMTVPVAGDPSQVIDVWNKFGTIPSGSPSTVEVMATWYDEDRKLYVHAVPCSALS